MVTGVGVDKSLLDHRNTALRKIRPVLGADHIELVEHPDKQRTVIDVRSYLKLGDGQSRAFEEELGKLLGSAVTVEKNGGDYVSSVTIDMPYDQCAEKLAGLTAVNTGSIKHAMGKHDKMQVQP